MATIWPHIEKYMPSVPLLFRKANPFETWALAGSPVHRFHATLGTAVPPHRDPKDHKTGSIIAWVTTEGMPFRGQFVLHDFLMQVVPKPGHLTMMYLRTCDITHGTSVPPQGAPTAYMIGMALANNHHDINMGGKEMASTS